MQSLYSRENILGLSQTEPDWKIVFSGPECFP